MCMHNTCVGDECVNTQHMYVDGASVCMQSTCVCGMGVCMHIMCVEGQICAYKGHLCGGASVCMQSTCVCG